MIWNYLPYMLEGLILTFQLVGGGLALGFALGLPTALGQVYGNRLVKSLLHAYVWFFRSTPLVVLLFLFYWGVFPSLGFKLSPLTTSILVLGFRSGAYQSQIFRGGVGSVGEEQLMAARSIGMSKWGGISRIVVPQALRVSIPGWLNEYAIILKDSAVCFTLGVLEILNRTRYIVIATAKPLIPYFTAGAIFIILTYAGTRLGNWIYERIKIPGLVGRM